MAAASLSLLVFASAFALATARGTLLTAARTHTPSIKRWGGWILLGVGLWVLALAVFAEPLAEVFPV